MKRPLYPAASQGFGAPAEIFARHFARACSSVCARQRASASSTPPGALAASRAAASDSDFGGAGGFLPKGMLIWRVTGWARSSPVVEVLSRTSAGLITRGPGLTERGGAVRSGAEAETSGAGVLWADAAPQAAASKSAVTHGRHDVFIAIPLATGIMMPRFEADRSGVIHRGPLYRQEHHMTLMIRHLLCGAALALAAGPGFSADYSDNKPATADPLAAARTQIAAKNWPAAIEELKRVDDKGSADWNNLMGYSLRKGPTPDYAAAGSYYDEALRIDPKHRGALEYSGELYLMTGDLPKAEERLATLDKLCSFGCAEYTALKKAVQSYKANGNKYVAAP